MNRVLLRAHHINHREPGAAYSTTEAKKGSKTHSFPKENPEKTGVNGGRVFTDVGNLPLPLLPLLP